MAINAELFNGTILEFPDGTDPSVIQSVVKRETAKIEGNKIADESWDATRGFKAYMPQTKETWGAAQTLMGVGLEKLFGKDSEMAQYMIEHGLANIKEGKAGQQVLAKPNDEFLTAWNDGIGSVVTDWLP